MRRSSPSEWQLGNRCRKPVATVKGFIVELIETLEATSRSPGLRQGREGSARRDVLNFFFSNEEDLNMSVGRKEGMLAKREMEETEHSWGVPGAGKSCQRIKGVG